jgi:hypothetical protein
MSYKIWKASIEEYRIKDMATNEVRVLKDFTLLGCKFKVNLKLYNEAKKNNFENSGNPFDFFAWIEADEVLTIVEPLLNDKVFYNPFKGAFFKDRESGKQTSVVSKLVIKGNTLSYE